MNTSQRSLVDPRRERRSVPPQLVVLVAAVAIVALLAGGHEAGARQSGYPKLSPFEALDWERAAPQVQVDGAWYELVSIDGAPAGEIVRFCQERYGRTSATGPEWRKRFEEDLVEVLHLMGRPPRESRVDLVLRNAAGAEVRMEDVPMTAENRQRIWQVAQERALASEAREPLSRRAMLDAVRAARRQRLSRAQAQEDLRHLARIIATRYSYRDLSGFDWRAAMQELSSGLGQTIDRSELAIQIARLLARFGDGHARLDGFELPPGYAPVLTARFEDRLYAFEPDRSGLVDHEHPVLLAIDGVPVERWLEVARRWAVDGSPQLRRLQEQRILRHVAFLRTQLDLAPRSQVTLRLGTKTGRKVIEKVVPIVDEKPRYGVWPAGASRRLEKNVGYLRLARMASGSELLDQLTETMEGFRDTDGLIVDVRGNGGGSRDALRILLPYFLEEDEVAVVNVARYRLEPGDDPKAPTGYLEDRYLYPLSSQRWSAEQRAVIERLRATFEPSWTPGDVELSDWHAFAISRSDNPAAYRYSAPVAVLQDAGCFSATDVFLGAFARRPEVTLIGTPSGGGSGRALSYELPVSGLRVRLPSMISYRPDGRLYERLGVEPDLVVEPVPTDFTGETDTVLAAALRHLRKARRSRR